MTREEFPFYTHFTDHLPRGPDGVTRVGAMFHLTIFDGHASRWSIEGINILNENKVMAACLPSHCSIYGQVSNTKINCCWSLAIKNGAS